MAEIITAAIDTIATNPYRRLHAYPYLQGKLDALQRSIAEVGLWPSIVVRPLSERLWKYEMAFGHHRIEAARRSGLKEVPIIVESLSDKQMLQYMGRENLEDYNAVFLIQLESWEAAIKSGLIRPTNVGQKPQPIDVAQLLGWTDSHSVRGTPQLNATAMACHAAYALIEGGYMPRQEFADLTVSAARDIAGRALARIEQIDRVGAGSARPRREIEAAKKHVGQGARDTARQVRQGAIPSREIRSRVDFNAAIHGRERPSPLFAVFANAVAENLRRTLQTDSDSDKLEQIEKVLSQLSMLEDWEALSRLDVELLNLARRAESWQKRLIPPKEKIVHFKALEKRGG